jgi:osmotically-inducible protein OsmY
MKSITSILAAAFLGSFLAVGCANLGEKSVGATIDDAAIVTKTKAAFAADPTVKAKDIKVTAYQGTVQLSGFAESAEEARRAEQIAREIKGVKSVKNDIRLASR